MLYDKRQRIYKTLNRPLTRPLLAVAATMMKSVICREPCFVWYKEGQWIHRHPDGYLVERQIMLRPIAHFHAMNTDYFLHSYRLRSGDVAIDGGACTGWETLLFSELVCPLGRVIAIEAHPVTYKCLTEMCRRNHLANVVPLQCAVGDAAGTVTITDFDYRQQSNTIVGGTGVITVKLKTIDNIVSELGIKHVDLIKLNIEGSELNALCGAKETLSITQHLAVSCHDFAAHEFGEIMRTKSKVRSLLEKAGFRVTDRPDDPRTVVRDFLYADRS
jgi:FkbM family methyltransferase